MCVRSRPRESPAPGTLSNISRREVITSDCISAICVILSSRVCGGPYISLKPSLFDGSRRRASCSLLAGICPHLAPEENLASSLLLRISSIRHLRSSGLKSSSKSPVPMSSSLVSKRLGATRRGGRGDESGVNPAPEAAVSAVVVNLSSSIGEFFLGSNIPCLRRSAILLSTILLTFF